MSTPKMCTASGRGTWGVEVVEAVEVVVAVEVVEVVVVGLEGRGTSSSAVSRRFSQKALAPWALTWLGVGV